MTASVPEPPDPEADGEHWPQAGEAIRAARIILARTREVEARNAPAPPRPEAAEGDEL